MDRLKTKSLYSLPCSDSRASSIFREALAPSFRFGNLDSSASKVL